MIIEKIPIDQIHPAKYNPRKDLKPGDPEYEQLKKSITTWGYIDTLVWNKRSGNLISGHQRLKILKENGLKEVEVSVVDLDDGNEKALNVALNKISGDWDNTMLLILLDEIKLGGVDVELTGFSEDELSILSKNVGADDGFDPDKAISKIKEPITQTGDIWILGRHKLMCGDCTKKDDMHKLVEGKKIDALITDPPYGVDYNGKTKEKLTIQNDDLNPEQFNSFLLTAFKNIYDITKPGGCWYIWHADARGLQFRYAMKAAGVEVRQCIIWVKNSICMGRQDYHWKHEPCLYGWKEGAAHYFTADRTNTTIIEDQMDLEKLNKNELLLLLKDIYYGGQIPTTVLRHNKPCRNDIHPTMKPIPLMGELITNSTKKQDIILDSFAGSGSTLIACEQLDRIAFLMEIDPIYCDVIVQRWEKFTSQKAHLQEVSP